MPYKLIILSSLAFLGLHELNGLLFNHLSLNSHISLIYLPGFLRLLNVLVLGPVFGTLATMLGGILILPFLDTINVTEAADIFCSGLGPLIAIYLFKININRSVDPTITKDLLFLGLIYSFSNTLLHHLAWVIIEPSALVWSMQFFEMMLGDINGVLLGALALKTIVKLPFIRKKIDQLDKL